MTDREYKNREIAIKKSSELSELRFILEDFLSRISSLEKRLEMEEKQSSLMHESIVSVKSIGDNKISALAKMTRRAIEFDDPGAVQVDIFTPTASGEAEEDDD